MYPINSITPLHLHKIKKKVNIDTKYNKMIIIQGLSFYMENNMKKDMWWTATELNNIRKMFTNELTRMKRLNPQWSITQCIHELYRLEAV